MKPPEPEKPNKDDKALGLDEVSFNDCFSGLGFYNSIVSLLTYNGTLYFQVIKVEPPKRKPIPTEPAERPRYICTNSLLQL